MGDTSNCQLATQQHSSGFNYPLAQHGAFCYEYITKPYQWAGAEHYCSINGGHLVSISSNVQQDFVMAFIKHTGRTRIGVWIGLNDIDTEGAFKWTSGNAFTYSNWLPGRLSNFLPSRYEDCVTLIPFDDGGWDDLPCGQDSPANLLPFICQFPAAMSSADTN